MMLSQKENMSVPKLITGRHVPWGYTVGTGRTDPRLGVYRRLSQEDPVLMRSGVTDKQLVQLIDRNGSFGGLGLGERRSPFSLRQISTLSLLWIQPQGESSNHVNSPWSRRQVLTDAEAPSLPGVR